MAITNNDKVTEAMMLIDIFEVISPIDAASLRKAMEDGNIEGITKYVQMMENEMPSSDVMRFLFTYHKISSEMYREKAEEKSIKLTNKTSLINNAMKIICLTMFMARVMIFIEN